MSTVTKEMVATVPPYIVAPGIQAGRAPRTVPGKLTVKFAQPFMRTPVVVVSPYWAHQSNIVSYIETIIEVNSEDFTVTCPNNAPDSYFVNWVAYGPM